MPGEASVTFEVAGAEVREGDLDLVGLTASRFLDGPGLKALRRLEGLKTQVLLSLKHRSHFTDP